MPLSKNEYADAVDICACFNLRSAARSVTRLFDDVLEPSGLRSTQFVTLVSIHVDGPVELPSLARNLHVDRSTLTRNLAPLERDGFVARKTTPSGAVEVKLTAKGRRKVERAAPYWAEAQGRFEKRMGKRRWKSLVGELGDALRAAEDA